MFEITDPCFAASTTAARSPKSNSSHCRDTAETVPSSEPLLLKPVPGADLMPAAALISANGARRDVREIGAFGDPRGKRGAPRVVPGDPRRRIVRFREIDQLRKANRPWRHRRRAVTEPCEGRIGGQDIAAAVGGHSRLAGDDLAARGRGRHPRPVGPFRRHVECRGRAASQAERGQGDDDGPFTPAHSQRPLLRYFQIVALLLAQASQGAPRRRRTPRRRPDHWMGPIRRMPFASRRYLAWDQDER